MKGILKNSCSWNSKICDVPKHLSVFTTFRSIHREVLLWKKLYSPTAYNFTKNELLQSCFLFFFVNTYFKEHIWMSASGLLFYLYVQYEQKEEY